MPTLQLPPLVPKLPERPVDAHKGMYGHGLLVGGFQGMAGAIWIAGHACLRGGAGLVTLAVPLEVQRSMAPTIPCAMTLGLGEGGAEDWLSEFWRPKFVKATLAIGPGLGRDFETDRLVERLWGEWPRAAVFDADALNVLSEATATGGVVDRSNHAGPRILTPHPGEWERLTGVSRNDRKSQTRAAKSFAEQWNAVIVLKGARTYITNGELEYLNETGNPSLAVGGSGDCLTGILTAMLCQGLPPISAAILGVYLHGLCADIAHETLGTPSTLATDLMDHFPAAFRAYRLACASQ